MSDLSIQDQIPGNHCYGCGPDNEQGMQIKSYWQEEGTSSICRYQPQPYHCAGPTTITYGGLIASVIDCHCVCTAIAAFYHQEGQAIGSQPPIWAATGKLDINYLKAAPIEQALELTARIEEITAKKVVLSCDIHSGGVLCATATVIAVKVPDSWKE